MTRFATAAAIALLTAASLATAQPVPAPEDRPLAGPDTADRETPRHELERALRARLRHIERQEQELRETIDKLESGEDVDVRRLMRDARGFGHERMDDDRRGRDGRGRFSRGPGGPGGADREPLTDEQRANVIAFLKEHDPRMYERFAEFRRERPEFAKRMFERHAHRVLDLMQLKEEDHEAFQTRLRAMQSFGKIREVVTDAIAEGTLDSDDTRRKLRELIALRLDVEEARYEREIEELSDRIKQLRAKLEEDRAERRERIDEAVSKIIERARAFRDRVEDNDESASN